MALADVFKAPFYQKQFYHVYNRTNNKELLFVTDTDRIRFLHKIEQYLIPYMDIFAWSLLPNHFHLYVRIKSERKIEEYLNSLPAGKLCNTERKFIKRKTSLHALIENSFARFFISYSSIFNRIYHRNGNLFHRPFKHIYTNSENQLHQTILYINTNAVKHNLASSINDYKWSSYWSLITERNLQVPSKELFILFGGKEAFINHHKDKMPAEYTGTYALDDES